MQDGPIRDLEVAAILAAPQNPYCRDLGELGRRVAIATQEENTHVRGLATYVPTEQVIRERCRLADVRREMYHG